MDELRNLEADLEAAIQCQNVHHVMAFRVQDRFTVLKEQRAEAAKAVKSEKDASVSSCFCEKLDIMTVRRYLVLFRRLVTGQMECSANEER